MYTKLVIVSLALLAASSCGIEAKNNPLAVKLTRDLSPKDDVNACQGCRSIVSYMSRFNSSTHRAEYRELFRDFCQTYYPTSTDYQQGPCPLLVESIFFIIDKTDVVNQCDQIGACGPYEAPIEEPEAYRINSIDSRNNLIFCDVCQQAVEKFKEIASDPKLKEQTLQVVRNFCSYLKAIGEDQECNNQLLAQLVKVSQWITKLQPRAYCSSIGVCSPKVLARKTVFKLPTLADFSDFGIETSVSYGRKPSENLEETDGSEEIRLKKNSAPNFLFNLDLDGLNSLAAAKSFEESRLNSPNCALCKTFVQEMFKFLRDNTTEANIREGLDKICQLIYKNEDKRQECEGMVKAYTKEIVELLVDETDPQMICILLQQCTDMKYFEQPQSLPKLSPIVIGEPPQTPAPKRVNFGDILNYFNPIQGVASMRSCVECKLVIRYLHDTIEDPKSEQKIQRWLMSNVCANIEDESLKKSCGNFVTEYSNSFFKALTEQLNPQEACADLGACKRRPAVWTIDNGTPANRFQKDQGMPPLSKKLKARENLVCEQCVEIISKLDDYLSSHPIDQDVTVIVEQVCDKLENDSLKNQCTILVKTMGHDIAQAISTMDNPRELCSKFLLCSA